MAISVFPSGGGEFVTNDFVVDMNDTSNNVIDLGRAYASGAYDISLASGDSSFDIYAVDADGNSVGYTKDATMVTTGEFTTLAILGVAQDERITFAFAGASNDATSEGDATGGGAYLENATPTDLPNQDDTTTVTGGNFASDVQIFFESGATSTAAKNITRNDPTELIVTRPDALDPDLDPWSLRAVNPGVPEPTGTDANILTDIIDAGATPVWVSTSPLESGLINQAYSETLEATDADGDVSYVVTSGNLPAGLSLDGATGVISGTPTGSGETFTVTVTDEGGNSNDREFTIPVAAATGGTVSSSGNFVVHTFNSSGDFEAVTPIDDLEYIILAGGGGGGESDADRTAGAGGGGGGLLSSISGFQSGENTAALASENITAGTYTVTVGAGGPGGASFDPAVSGSDSSIVNIGTATGGGFAGSRIGGLGDGGNGGSGGGGADNGSAGNGTSGQGFQGSDPIPFVSNSNSKGSGSGGGAGSAAIQGDTNDPGSGGAGLSNFLDSTGWGAGGGGGGQATSDQNSIAPGAPGGSSYAGNGGNSSARNANSGSQNFGGGGGGAGADADLSGGFVSGGSGGSGKVVIRYEG